MLLSQLQRTTNPEIQKTHYITTKHFLNLCKKAERKTKEAPKWKWSRVTNGYTVLNLLDLNKVLNLINPKIP